MKASDLRVGDRIRLRFVPEADLRDRAARRADPDFLPTATVLEQLIATRSVVVISHIDEYGQPWFDTQIRVGGEMQDHSVAIMDDESWCLITL